MSVTKTISNLQLKIIKEIEWGKKTRQHSEETLKNLKQAYESLNAASKQTREAEKIITEAKEKFKYRLNEAFVGEIGTRSSISLLVYGVLLTVIAYSVFVGKDNGFSAFMGAGAGVIIILYAASRFFRVFDPENSDVGFFGEVFVPMVKILSGITLFFLFFYFFVDKFVTTFGSFGANNLASVRNWLMAFFLLALVIISLKYFFARRSLTPRFSRR